MIENDTIFLIHFLNSMPTRIFHFYISRPSKFNFMGSHCICILMLYVKYILHVKDNTLKPVNVGDIVVYAKFANFCYTTCFAPNLVLIP